MPYVSERMRKRRAFADKELETVMFERERQVEAEKVKLMQQTAVAGQHHPHLPPVPTAAAVTSAAVMDPKSRQLMGQLSPKEFLQRIFPAVNPNVLELVWQGCGGDLERAIEQIVSNNSMSSLHAAHMAQQMALQHRLMAAQMAALTGGKLPGGGGMVVPPGGNLTHSLPGGGAGAAGAVPGEVCPAALLQHQVAAAQGKHVGSSDSAFSTPASAKPGGPPGHTQMVAPPLSAGFPVGHPAAIAGLYSYQAAQAALMARMCPNGQPNLPGHHPPRLGQSVSSRSNQDDHKELLSQKSAFSCGGVAPARTPESSSLSPASSRAGSSGASKSPGGMESPQSCSDGAKSPIKFSVESIIGKWRKSTSVYSVSVILEIPIPLFIYLHLWYLT